MQKTAGPLESFEGNMTGSQDFADVKKAAIARIIENINSAGSLANLESEKVQHDNELVQQAMQKAADKKKLRRTFGQRQLSTLESFVQTATF